MGSDDLEISVAFLNLAEELLEAVAQGSALGEPEGKACAHSVGEGEEFHLLAQDAVVAFLGLFEEGKILIEHFLLGESHTIYTHELVALLVAAPVSAGEGGDLHRLDRGSVGDMRTTAEVGKRALSVCGNMAIFELTDKFALILLAAIAEHLESVGLRDIGANDLLLIASEFEHFSLDFGEILGCNLIFSRVDIVIEPGFDGGADTELHAGIQFLEGFSQKVG